MDSTTLFSICKISHVYNKLGTKSVQRYNIFLRYANSGEKNVWILRWELWILEGGGAEGGLVMRMCLIDMRT